MFKSPKTAYQPCLLSVYLMSIKYIFYWKVLEVCALNALKINFTEIRNELNNTKKRKKKMGLCLLYINMLMLGSFSQYFLMLYMKVTCTLIALYKSWTFLWPVWYLRSTVHKWSEKNLFEFVVWL